MEAGGGLGGHGASASYARTCEGSAVVRNADAVVRAVVVGGASRHDVALDATRVPDTRRATRTDAGEVRAVGIALAGARAQRAHGAIGEHVVVARRTVLFGASLQLTHQASSVADLGHTASTRGALVVGAARGAGRLSRDALKRALPLRAAVGAPAAAAHRAIRVRHAGIRVEGAPVARLSGVGGLSTGAAGEEHERSEETAGSGHRCQMPRRVRGLNPRGRKAAVSG